MERGKRARVGFQALQICVLLLLPLWLFAFELDFVRDFLYVTRILSVFYAPFTIWIYSSKSFRPSSENLQISILKGLVALPSGVFLSLFFSLCFGASISLKIFESCIHWAILFSLFTIVPFCLSHENFFSLRALQSLLTFQNVPKSKSLNTSTYTIIYGTAIGTYLASFLVPLDWQELWQEWPICCSMGMLLGHFFGLCMSTFWLSAENWSEKLA